MSSSPPVFALAALALSAITGCPQPVPATCAAYIDCQAAYDEATGLPPVDTSSYAEGSPCWTEPDSAQFCEDECRAGLDALIQATTDEGLDLPACAQPADEALEPAASAIAPTSTAG